jgi:glycosyltransferase involved in cell wall biosynthesis
MKILTLTSLFPNAVKREFGVFVYQRVAAFAKRCGNEVQVLAPVPYFPRWIPLLRWRTFGKIPRHETIGELQVSHPRYPLLPGLMPLHGLFIFLGCLLEARRLHQLHDFDCIDAHYVYPDGFAAILIGRVLGIPVFLSARGTDINVFPAFRLIRPMIRWSLKRAAGIVAVSAALRETIIGLGIRSEKIKAIINGVDPNRFFVSDRAAARTQLGIRQDAEVIVSVGSLIPAKSHELLIRAVAQLRSKAGQKTRLYIVGEGPLMDQLKALIGELHLREQAYLIGGQSNEMLHRWFNAADLSVLTSAREGMPNVVLESLACGTPVLATRVGGVPEVLVSEQLGILVEPSVEAIAAGIERALNSEWNRESISRHAQTRTWDAVAEEVEKYFSSVCKVGLS